MEAIVGYDHAILIDAITTPIGLPGSVYRLSPSDLVATRNTGSSHDSSLAQALEFGRTVGLRLPREITIWAVEAGDVHTFGEDLTSRVESAVPAVVQGVLKDLAADGEKR